MVDAEVALFQVLAELGDDTGKDEILRVLLERGDIDNLHRAVLKAPERQIAHRAIVGDQSRAPRRDVGQPVPHFANDGLMVRAPTVVVLALHGGEDVTEPAFEIGERAHEVVFVPEQLGIREFAIDHALANEVNQRVGLRVDVVFASNTSAYCKTSRSPPGQRRHIVQERLVRTRGIQ